MLYKINNGAVSFGADVILHGINFEIRNTEKIAVVGRNGCGKTTLLKLISGEVELSKRDSDEDIFIAKSGNPTIGYLKQMAFEDESITMEEEIRKVFLPMVQMKEELDRRLQRMNDDPSERNVKSYAEYEENFRMQGGYYYEKEFETMVRKFGFTEEDKKKSLNQFSGGQKTRIAFIRMLLSKPDILLLDEPTNHLDISTVEWLEGYLKNYSKAVVIVSHDRMFLDNIAEVVYEIEYGTAKRYVGNYSDFIIRKKEEHEKQQKDYELQQKEIARLNTIVDKFKNKPTKVAMTRSKLKAIEHMDKIEAPDQYDNKTFHANLTPLETTGKEVLNVMNLGVGYDGKVLSTVNFTVTRGDKIGIIGGNGLGKSTFLKTIMGMIPPVSGEYHTGLRVDIGYFDQQMASYTSDKQVIDDYHDEFPTLTETEVRSDLGAFLFSQDAVFKKVNMLSGGERVRLALCKILKRRPNFLILDEPTNHMDIVGKETLEQMLLKFEGTILFVSHDRYFIKRISNKLVVFENGYTDFFSFGYDDYMKKKALEAEIDESSNSKSLTGKTPFSFVTKQPENDIQSEQKKVKNYDNPGKERSKLEKKISKFEKIIEELEDDIAKYKEELNAPENASAYYKLTEIQGHIDELEIKLMDTMEQWEEASKELSELFQDEI